MIIHIMMILIWSYISWYASSYISLRLQVFDLSYITVTKPTVHYVPIFIFTCLLLNFHVFPLYCSHLDIYMIVILHQIVGLLTAVGYLKGYTTHGSHYHHHNIYHRHSHNPHHHHHILTWRIHIMLVPLIAANSLVIIVEILFGGWRLRIICVCHTQSKHEVWQQLLLRTYMQHC